MRLVDAIIALTFAVPLGYDALALAFGWQTVSGRVRELGRKYPAFIIPLAVALSVGLLLHWFGGF